MHLQEHGVGVQLGTDFITKYPALNQSILRYAAYVPISKFQNKYICPLICTPLFKVDAAASIYACTFLFFLAI